MRRRRRTRLVLAAEWCLDALPDASARTEAPEFMVKYTQRLDYGRLADVLHERGLVDSSVLGDLLQASSDGGTPFPEALVTAKLIGDWDLSRIVCEAFNLPFLPLDVAPPDLEASAGLDKEFLVQNGLIPISRFGQVLTVSMPALVPADVLGLMSAMFDLVILPIVGSVQTNRRWIEENLEERQISTAPTGAGRVSDSDWRNLFDSADAAVQNALGGEIEDMDSLDSLDSLDEMVAGAASLVASELEGLEEAEGEIEFAGFEVAPAVLEDYELDEAPPSPSASPSSPSPSAGNPLPPMPDFG